MSLPLSDVTVVDLTRLIAGPVCTQYLADFGAEVIKIEPPAPGDEARIAAPVNGSISGLFAALNRNKRSIALDLNQPRAREIVRALVEKADVLVENFASGVVEKFGLDYASLKEINPALIYCSISAFGRDGPKGRAPGFELSVQGFSGLMAVTGTEDSGPLRVGFSPLDHTTGYHAAMGVMAALRHRDKTGQGQHVHASLLETALTFLTWHINDYWMDGRLPQRPGSGHTGYVPYQAFRAGDGDIIIAVANDNLWHRLCNAIGRPELDEDPRFATNAARVAHRAILVEELHRTIGTRPRSEWAAIFDADRIPYSVVNGIAEALAEPQVHERGLVLTYTDQGGSSRQCLAAPVMVDPQWRRTQVRSPPPHLGEHTEEILTSIGFSPEDIASCRSAGVLG